MSETLPKVTIYTDGACFPNNGTGQGGWGAVIFHNNEKKEIYGGDDCTTNNKMEMLACIRALESIPEKASITLKTDSKYLVNGMKFWVAGWKRKNWVTQSGEAVKNREMWERLDHLCRHHVVDWKWIKGHAGNTHNERADQLACQGKEEAKQGKWR